MDALQARLQTSTSATFSLPPVSAQCLNIRQSPRFIVWILLSHLMIHHRCIEDTQNQTAAVAVVEHNKLPKPARQQDLKSTPQDQTQSGDTEKDLPQ